MSTEINACEEIARRLVAEDPMVREKAEDDFSRLVSRRAEAAVWKNSRANEMSPGEIANDCTRRVMNALRAGRCSPEGCAVYLHRTIRNRIIDEAARLPLPGQIESLTEIQDKEDGPKVTEAPDLGLTPEQALLQAERDQEAAARREVFGKALHSLSDKCRKLLLFVFGGVGTQEQFAATEGQTAAAVRKQKQRCVEQLTLSVRTMASLGTPLSAD